jgi:hypothetical protein
MPPPRLERGFLPPEGNALSTELWGRWNRSGGILPRLRFGHNEAFYTLDRLFFLYPESNQDLFILKLVAFKPGVKAAQFRCAARRLFASCALPPPWSFAAAS